MLCNAEEKRVILSAVGNLINHAPDQVRARQLWQEHGRLAQSKLPPGTDQAVQQHETCKLLVDSLRSKSELADFQLMVRHAILATATAQHPLSMRVFRRVVLGGA
jgi:hypothetical protein